MRHYIPSINNLRAFEAAARLGGFNLAADELNLSPPTVSYRISKLESDLEVLLFERLTRRIALTKDGEAFLPFVATALKQLQEGMIKLGNDTKRSIKVTLSSYLAMRWLSPRLANWSARNPNVSIHLDHDMRKGAEESDVVIYWSRDAVERQSAQLLFAVDMTVYCSPKIAATLKTPEDVLKYPLLKMPPHMDTFADWLKICGVEETPDTTTLLMTDSNVRVKAAVDGVGVVMGNKLANPELKAGLLVKPFDIDLVGAGFFCRSQSNSPDLADRFVQWLKKMSAIED